MPITNVKKCDCNLCGNSKTAETVPPGWCALEVGSDQHGHPDRTVAVCPECASRIHGIFSQSMMAKKS